MAKDKIYSVPEFLQALKEELKPYGDRIEAFKTKCLELRKKETELLAKNLKKDMTPVGSFDGTSGGLGDMGQMAMAEDDPSDPLCPKCSKLRKNCKCMVKNGNDYIDLHNENDPDKRDKTLSGGLPVKLPGDKKPDHPKGDEGSGGEIKKDEDMPKMVGSAIPPPHPGMKPAKLPGVTPPKAPRSATGMSNPGGTPKGMVASKSDNLDKKHIGFDALKDKVEHEGYSADSANKIAAAVGRKKYGAHRMAEAAHEGKPANKVKKAEPMKKVPMSPLPPPTGSNDLAMNEKGLSKKSPPGWSEEDMHKLKAKHGEESAFKIAWAAYDKAHGKKPHKKSEAEPNDEAKKVKKNIALPGQKAKLPDMSGFKSLVPNKPKPAVSSTEHTNNQLSSGFRSLATNPTAGPKSGGGKMEGGFPDKNNG